MWKKKKFLIGGIIILLAIGSLGFMAFKGAATYYYTVTEVTGIKGSSLAGQNIRVAGQVAAGSLVQEPSNSKNINFVLRDTINTSDHLSISYNGNLPDAFKEGNDAVIEGSLSSSGVFKATQIIVKCPSKYEPKQ